MKQIIYLLTILLASAGCNNSHSKFSLVKQHECLLRGVKLSTVTPMNWYDSSDGMHLWLKISDSCIGHYAFRNQRVIDSIGIRSKRLPQSFDFDIIRDGEVYIFDFKRQSCGLFDRSGLEIHRYRYTDSSRQVFLRNFPMVRSRDHRYFFYCPFMPTGPNYEQLYYADKTVAEIDFADSTMHQVQLHCPFPKKYRQALYDETEACATVLPAGLAYMFSTDPILYIDRNGTTEQHTIRGLTTNSYPPVLPDSVMYITYNNRVGLEMDVYIQLLYDDKSKTYLLFQSTPPSQQNNEMEELSRYKDKPFSIYIIDSTFSVRGIKKFDFIGDYRLTEARFSNGILYLPKVSLETNLLKIETYAITKNQ